jgi:hypothetical protein
MTGTLAVSRAIMEAGLESGGPGEVTTTSVLVLIILVLVGVTVYLNDKRKDNR